MVNLVHSRCWWTTILLGRPIPGDLWIRRDYWMTWGFSRQYSWWSCCGSYLPVVSGVEEGLGHNCSWVPNSCVYTLVEGQNPVASVLWECSVLVLARRQRAVPDHCELGLCVREIILPLLPPLSPPPTIHGAFSRKLCVAMEALLIMRVGACWELRMAVVVHDVGKE